MDSQQFLQTAESTTPDVYPECWAMSPVHFFQFVVVDPANSTGPPEYVYVRCGKRDLALRGVVGEWTMSWESGHWRPDLRADLPASLQWLGGRESLNIRLVPWDGTTKYPAHAGLFHLLPRSTLERFGLPLLRRGLWPPAGALARVLLRVPDFDARLSQALSYHLWPHLSPGNPPSAFSKDEPLKVLTHNLDYWMPFLDCIIQRRIQAFGRYPYDSQKQRSERRRAQRHMPPGLRIVRPLRGGPLWMGEAEAREVTGELIAEADRSGHLRALIEAVRSHRVQDDFSSRWSCAKEDFERKLYRKRSKVRVTFVELRDSLPVHGPGSEADERILWGDFLSLLNPKERRIVVCLRSGETRLTEIAKEIGYANHSPVSKALTAIRRKARRFLDA